MTPDKPAAFGPAAMAAGAAAVVPGVSCEAHQLEKRERLCRYIARPTVTL